MLDEAQVSTKNSSPGFKEPTAFKTCATLKSCGFLVITGTASKIHNGKGRMSTRKNSVSGET